MNYNKKKYMQNEKEGSISKVENKYWNTLCLISMNNHVKPNLVKVLPKE